MFYPETVPFFASFWSTLQLATIWLAWPGLGSGGFYRSSFFSGCLVVHPARSYKRMPTKTRCHFYSLEGHTRTCIYIFLLMFQLFIYSLIPRSNWWRCPIFCRWKNRWMPGWRKPYVPCVQLHCQSRDHIRMGRMGLVVSRLKVLYTCIYLCGVR